MVPFLVPLAGTAAAGLGLTAAGTALVSKVDALRDAFGQTSKKQGQVEAGDSYKRSKGKIGTMDRSLGEKVGDIIFQRDPQKILEAASNKYTEDIMDSELGVKFGSLQDRLAGLGLETKLKKLGDTESKAEFTQRLTDREKAIGKLETLRRLQKRLGPVNLSSYNLNNTADIDSEIDRLTPLVTNKDTKASVEYQDNLKREEREIRRHYADRADQRADRQAEREMLMLNANQDRELKRFELEQGGRSRKAELFQALFGLGSAFMI